jgi:hypothetical protein
MGFATPYNASLRPCGLACPSGQARLTARPPRPCRRKCTEQLPSKSDRFSLLLPKHSHAVVVAAARQRKPREPNPKALLRAEQKQRRRTTVAGSRTAASRQSLLCTLPARARHPLAPRSLSLRPTGALRPREQVWADTRPALLVVRAAAQPRQSLHLLPLGQPARGQAAAVSPPGAAAPPSSLVLVTRACRSITYALRVSDQRQQNQKYN